MSHCPHCGAQYDGGNFCGHCGKPSGPLNSGSGESAAPYTQGPQAQAPYGSGTQAQLPYYPGHQVAGARSGGAAWKIAGVVVGLLVLVGVAALSLSGGESGGGTAVSGKPSGTSAPAGSSASKLPSDPNNPLVGGYIRMRIPGAAYTQSNGTTLTLYTSTGALTTSSLVIFPDGTFAWNSQWDGKIIKGNWVKAENDIVLKKGQEGKDWRVTAGTKSTGGDIVIMDGSIWYLADRAKD